MIRKCLFPVAGYGTRFLPATKAMPKEMLPVVNKPLVQYGVEEAAEAGMNRIGFITGRGKRAIADHFDISYELEKEIEGSGKESLLTSIRTLIDENDEIRNYRFWMHYFKDKEMISLLQAKGFRQAESVHNILPANDIWDGENVTFYKALK